MVVGTMNIVPTMKTDYFGKSVVDNSKPATIYLDETVTLDNGKRKKMKEQITVKYKKNTTEWCIVSQNGFLLTKSELAPTRYNLYYEGIQWATWYDTFAEVMKLFKDFAE